MGKKTVSLKVSSLDEMANNDHEVIMLVWDVDWTLNQVSSWFKTRPQIRKVIHVLNGSASVVLPHLEKIVSGSIEHLYFYKENQGLSRNERFEIATFLGEKALARNNPNQDLRHLYGLWSYEVMMALNDLSPEQSKMLEAEYKHAETYTFPVALTSWVKNLKSALEKSEIESDLSNFPRSAQSLKAILKKGVKKVLPSRSINPAPADNNIDLINLPPVNEKNPRHWKSILITGWYGTETAGDKAILGEIIHQMRVYQPDIKIYISSIDLRVSWQTRIEMDLNVEHIPIQKMVPLIKSNKLDAVIMGGGPLMESSQIIPIMQLFQEAAQQGINRVIFGCGVGPIHSQAMSSNIAQIIKLSNVAFYRDRESLDYALSLGGDAENSLLACDPATAFIRRWKETNPTEVKRYPISTMLREQTSEYEKDPKVLEKNRLFPEKVAKVLNNWLANNDSNGRPNLVAMHAYWRGNDDRALNVKIVDNLSIKILDSEFLRYRDIYQLIEELNASSYALAMRYHGHIFCLALNIPFLSLDYTGKKGKVSNLMSRMKLDEYSVKFKDFTSDLIQDKLNSMSENAAFAATLKNRSEELTKELENAYQHFWQ